METLISPSLLSANFIDLRTDIDMINRSEADWLHLDIMDGVFVPNISFGFPVIQAVAKECKKPLDVHLMIVHPEHYIKEVAATGAMMMNVHYEACTHLHRTIQEIHAAGMKAGVTLNPHTPVSVLEDIICDVDMVLLMSVNPGFGGQKFIPHSVEKTKRLRRLIEGLPARERKLILLRYGLAGQPPLTQLETAKLLQISRSYVSRLETHALELLRAGWEQP